MSVAGYLKDVYGELTNTFTERDPAAYIEAYARFHRRKSTEAVQAAVDDPARDLGGAQPAPVEGEVASHAAHAELMGELYKNLDTLDGKASGLLTYCGLVLAGSSFLVDRSDGTWIAFLSVVVVALAAVSALFAVQAIFLAWTPASKLADTTVGAEAACVQYYQVRQRRTRFYLVSWILITVTTLLFLSCLIWEYIDDATDLLDSGETPPLATGEAGSMPATGSDATPGGVPVE